MHCYGSSLSIKWHNSSKTSKWRRLFWIQYFTYFSLLRWGCIIFANITNFTSGKGVLTLRTIKSITFSFGIELSHYQCFFVKICRPSFLSILRNFCDSINEKMLKSRILCRIIYVKRRVYFRNYVLKIYRVRDPKFKGIFIAII